VGTDRLRVRTEQTADAGDLLSSLPQPTVAAWIHQGDGLVGWGEAARLTIPAGADRFVAGEKWLAELFDDALVSDEVGLPGSGPVAFGSFTFDPTCDGSVLVVPRHVIGRSGGVSWRTTIDDGSRDPEPPPLPVPPAGPATVRWSDGSLSAPQWQHAVAAAVSRIKAGELQKVVLSRDLMAVATEDFDVRLLLRRLVAEFPECYTYSCAGLVGATPDLLITRDGPMIRSLVLAGTAPRGGSKAEDEALGAGLLASAKNVEEHQYAVADERAALAPLCGTLEIEPTPSLLRLANLQHLATWVTGQLRPGQSGEYATALSLAAALHPTAAVCGTPAEAAMELIRELEGMDRGRYAGPVGWLDSRGNGEWGIALRCGEVAGNRVRLIAGGGIVAGSVPAAELAETEVKFRAMRRAIEG
jgi:menaquinone-specific isochorismate synthase